MTNNTMTANDRRFLNDFLTVVAKAAEDAIDNVYAVIGYASDENVVIAVLHADDLVHEIKDAWLSIKENDPHEYDFDEIVDDVLFQHQAMHDFIKFIFDDDEDDDE